LYIGLFYITILQHIILIYYITLYITIIYDTLYRCLRSVTMDTSKYVTHTSHCFTALYLAFAFQKISSPLEEEEGAETSHD